MKKTLIAIAALAATGAFAQSTVTIDGVIDAGYVSYDMKGAKASGIDRNLTSTSALNFRVNSDLGGGMRATWRSETNMVVTSNGANQGTVGNDASGTGNGANGTGATGLTNGTASTFMNGEQKLGLSGGFGEVAFGAINNTALFAHLWSQPFGTAIGSGFTATSGAAATAPVRNDNTFQYTSPVLAGGLKLNWINRKAQGGSAASNNGNFNASLGAQQQASVNSLAAAYSAGPLNAILTRDVQDATGVNGITAGTGVVTAGSRGTFTALAANYKLGAATVYGGWQNNKAQNGASATVMDRSTTTLAVRYDMGVNSFMASTQRAVNSLGGGTNSSLFALGYEYALSKTAAVTARYERIGDTAGFASVAGYAATAGNNDRSRMGVGLRVGF
jgi:predicted porin